MPNPVLNIRHPCASAGDPGTRLRDISAAIGITERTAHGILADLVEAGYVVKEREGRRNRYQIQAHLLVHTPIGEEHTVRELLAVLMDGAKKKPVRRRG